MSHQDKFWNKFGDKARQHKPDLYTPADWQQMERLLDNKPARRFPPIFLWSGGAVASVLAIVLIMWLLAPKPPALSALPIPMAEAPLASYEEPPHNADNSKIAENTAEKNITVEGASDTRRLPGLKQREKKKTADDRASIRVGEGSSQITAEMAKSDAIPGKSNDPKASDDKPLPSVNRTPISEMKAVATMLGPVSYTATAPHFDQKTDKNRWAFGSGFIMGGHLAVTRYSGPQSSAFPFLGLFASVSPHPRWSLQMELQARYVPAMTASYELALSSTPSSNLADSIQFAGKQRIDFFSIQAPLLVKYKAHPKWSFYAGMEYGMIISEPNFGSASDEYAVIPDSDFSSGEANLEARRAAKVATLRISDHSWGILAGTEWTFSEKWAVNLRLIHGLTDLSPDDLYGDDSRHRNSGLQLSLHKTF